MKHSTYHRAAACAISFTALVCATSGARADFGHSAIAYSTGSFIPTDPGLPVNTGYGTITQLADGSSISHMGCIAATAGGVGCSTSGQPIVVDTWYKRPTQPTLAAAQAYADYGVLKARSWRTGGETGDSAPGDPLGRRSYYAEAASEWSEVLNYSADFPTWVTMQFTLHATWNDLGRFAFSLGREYFGAENVRLIDGLSYINCAGAIECQDGDGTRTMQVIGDDAANTSGDVTLAIDYRFLLSKPYVDPEDPGSGTPFTFVANLMTWSNAPGAEADAFQTVTLDRILIEPGAEISFGSGHAWPVQVVPEPAAAWLWLAGLAAAAPMLRRRRTAAQGSTPD
jgi:hypothetical protein